MDYIREFDIKLEKEMFYAGEALTGTVILDTVENFKLRAIRVVLRGKAHTEWKVMVSGDRRTVRDDQYFIDDRAIIWGKEKAEGNVPILPRGMHQFPFRFQLPESSLPCSFESRAGTVRYYIKVTVDIPYASPPQGMKYFTIIGPHIDCMDDQYLKPMEGEAKKSRCCLCCEKGPLVLKTQLERSAYVCGESLRVKADIDNQSEEAARLKLRLVQYVEYYIDRGVLGVTKEVSHTILEYRGAPVLPHTRSKWDSKQTLVVSTMPPTLLGVCRLLQIYYMLKVNVELEKAGDDLHMHFPITIATVPFRIPNSTQQPVIVYDVASDHAEGGMYIGPEFQLGQVYDGSVENGDSVVLYRPVYICVAPTAPTGASKANCAALTSNNSKDQMSSSQSLSTGKTGKNQSDTPTSTIRLGIVKSGKSSGTATTSSSSSSNIPSKSGNPVPSTSKSSTSSSNPNAAVENSQTNGSTTKSKSKAGEGDEDSEKRTDVKTPTMKNKNMIVPKGSDSSINRNSKPSKSSTGDTKVSSTVIPGKAVPVQPSTASETATGEESTNKNVTAEA